MTLGWHYVYQPRTLIEQDPLIDPKSFLWSVVNSEDNNP